MLGVYYTQHGRKEVYPGWYLGGGIPRVVPRRDTYIPTMVPGISYPCTPYIHTLGTPSMYPAQRTRHAVQAVQDVLTALTRVVA